MLNQYALATACSFVSGKGSQGPSIVRGGNPENCMRSRAVYAPSSFRRSSFGSLAMLAALRRASSRGNSPLCKRLRKLQISAPERSAAKLHAEISNTPAALQSCETLPEGWPCLSTDSAQIGAVKVSYRCQCTARNRPARRTVALRVPSTVRP